MTPIQTLTALSEELCRLSEIEAILSWDMETYLPKNATEGRAQQSEVLARIIHEKRTGLEMKTALDNAKISSILTDDERALIRVMERSYRRSSAVTSEHAARESRLTTMGMQSWMLARTTDDFSQFAPILTELFDLAKQRAELIGYTDHPYDALLDGDAQGMTVALVDREFAKLKDALIPLIKHRMSVQKNAPFYTRIPVELQQKASSYLLKTIGYDFDSGRLDTVRHPFMTDLGPSDKRVTNRYSETSIHALFSALHEGGHALYEQGVAARYQKNDLSKHFSLAVHESQSRLWENIVGKSHQFWQSGAFEHIRGIFGEYFEGVTLEQFMEHIRHVQPVMIRVDSDELTYDLHIIIRYEIEKMVISGECTVADIPTIWNQKYSDYLGLEPQNLAEGCLQDVHWSIGAIGYFATYTLGNINASQIWHTYTTERPTWSDDFKNGNFTHLRAWLATHIHQHGSSIEPITLLEKVCKEPLNSDYYIARLTERYGH
jgi:carboxypeptidase Taq